MSESSQPDFKLAPIAQHSQAGNRLMARMDLEPAMSDLQDCVDAWLWQAWLADSPAAALASLERAAALNGDDKTVTAGIEFVTSLVRWSTTAGAVEAEACQEQDDAECCDAVECAQAEEECAQAEDLRGENMTDDDAAVTVDEEPPAGMTDIEADCDIEADGDAPITATEQALADTVAEADLQVVVEAEPEAAIEAEPEAVVEAEPKAVVEAEPEAVVEAEPEAVVEAEPEAVVEAEPEAAIEAEPEAAIEAEPEAVVEVEPEAVIEAEPEAAIEAEPEAVVQAAPEAVVETESNPDAEVELEAELLDEVQAINALADSSGTTAQDDAPSDPVCETEAVVQDEPQHEPEPAAEAPAAAAPTVEATADEAPVAPAPADETPADESPLVLAVDDSPTVRKLVALTLSSAGYEVITAADGVEALRMIADRLPVLILSDINMPKLGGYQLCKMIKKHSRTSSIPVIMLSGKDGVFDKLRGSMVGCSDYVTKPFESQDLIEKVRRYANTPDTASV
ncbi:MAG: response regulator [Planctomycetota bacterium]